MNSTQPHLDLAWIAKGHPLYKSELDLRFSVLRAPLNMPRGSEIYVHEEDTWHLIAHHNQRVVGCVLFHPQTDQESGKLLQMAVHPDFQGQRIGARLVFELERKAKEHFFSKIILNAREVAFPFYEKLGFSFTSDFFEEVGVPHKSMVKHLAAKT